MRVGVTVRVRVPLLDGVLLGVPERVLVSDPVRLRVLLGVRVLLAV